MRIAILTHFPSPYQVEFFNAIARDHGNSITVYYLHRSVNSRYWKELQIEHDACFLNSTISAIERAKQDVAIASLFVIAYYNDRAAGVIQKLRDEADLPWAFWGERPQNRVSRVLCRAYRAWKLSELHRSRAPIWGIGRLAVEAYAAEFGATRRYVNVPYFCDLDRFRKRPSPIGKSNQTDRVILFSGSLIHRKGVDLVARAFSRLVAEGHHVRLKLMGCGNLEGQIRKVLCNCQDRVDFLGFKDWDILPEVYGSADVLCVPSRYDGWGMVVPEGLAAGLPVISTTETGSAVEFLTTGSNGWLIPPGDFDALYEAMRNAATVGSETLAAMAGLARASVVRHSLADGVRRFVAAAHDVVANWATKKEELTESVTVQALRDCTHRA